MKLNNILFVLFACILHHQGLFASDVLTLNINIRDMNNGTIAIPITGSLSHTLSVSLAPSTILSGAALWYGRPGIEMMRNGLYCMLFGKSKVRTSAALWYTAAGAVWTFGCTAVAVMSSTIMGS